MTTAIDLFAGLGGLTEAAERAGIRVLWAANHWPVAVEYHQRNHPSVRHACQDLQQADFRDAPRHDVLLAAPSCVGHTHARGKDLPRHDAARATAWAVVTAAEVHRPPVVVVENVPELERWILYPAWVQALQALGYAVATVVADAADHGVPQHRRRLFVVATRSRAPLMLQLRPEPHQPIGPVLQWDRWAWSAIDRPGRSPKTLSRIARGRARFGDRFVMPYYGSGSGETGRSLDRPLGTVTTRDRWALVDGDRMRMLQPPEYAAAMGFSMNVALPERRDLAIHLLGNAVAPPQGHKVLSAVLEAA